MIYIVCDDYEQAQSAYNDLLEWLYLVVPDLCIETDEYANLIKDYDSDVDYYFIDEACLQLGWIDLNVTEDDVIDIYEFFVQDMLLQAQAIDDSYYFASVPLPFA